MSLNIKENGVLKRIAGSTVILDATAAEIRTGTFTAPATAGNTLSGDCTITFSIPMPDDQFSVLFESADATGGYVSSNIWGKTVNGFKVSVKNNNAADMPSTSIKYTAFKLVELENYTALQNKINNLDSAPTENSTNLVTSGGVYDAISSASKIFINSESAWNELEAETKETYQLAIFTDKPNVNAVDSTDGSTTVVGEPNKRWSGTTEEWEQFEADYPEEAAKIEVRYITDDSETGNTVDAVEDGNMQAVTSNAVYNGLCKSKSITVTTTSDWISGSIYVKQIGRMVAVTIAGGSWNYNGTDTAFATGLPKPVLNYYELALNVAGDTCTVIVDTQGRLLGGLSRGVNVWHSLVYITTE